MPDMFDHLNCELIDAIVKFISRDDCLEAMCVSRKWLHLLPSHATALWTTVDLCTPYTVLTKNERLLRCLRHVRRISVYYSDLNAVLQELPNDQVEIQSLTIRQKINDHDDSNKRTCTLNDMLKTSASLRCLTELSLMDYRFDKPLLDLARACPQQLTHLTIQLPSIITTSQRYATTERVAAAAAVASLAAINDQALLPHLLYLHLDARFRFHRIEPLLQHCPQLRVLQVSVNTIDEWDNSVPISTFGGDFEFTRVLQHCPHVHSIDSDFAGLCTWTSIPDAHNAECGLKTLRVAYKVPNNHADVIMAALRASVDTLEVLHLDQATPEDVDEDVRQWPSALLESDIDVEDWKPLSQIKLSTLRELSITVLTKDFGSNVIGLLRHHSHTLKRLSLTINSPQLTQELVEAIHSVTSLNRLSLTVDWTTRVLEEYMPSYISRIMAATAPNNFYLLVNRSRILHYIYLDYIALSDPLLHLLASSQSLRTIVLVANGADDEKPASIVTTNGLITFANTLRSNYTLKSLTLECFTPLDDNVMEALGRIESLEKLIVAYCPNITDDGLRRFADTVGDRKSSYNFSEYGCPQVTREGYTYVQEKLEADNK